MLQPRALLLLLILIPGCKSSSTELEVTGTVSLDSKPLANAVVRFIPIEGTMGLGGFGTTDASGKFTIKSSRENEKGQAPGQYKVVISRRLRPDGSEPEPNKPPIESDARETLPAIYSSDSATTLTAAVSAEKKAFEFELTATAKK